MNSSRGCRRPPESRRGNNKAPFGKEGAAAVRCKASCGCRRRHLAPQEVEPVGPLSSISSSSETCGPRGRPLPTSKQHPFLTTPSSPSTSCPPLCPSQSPVGLWMRLAFPPSPTIQICQIWLFSSCNNLRRLSRPAGEFHKPSPPCSPSASPRHQKFALLHAKCRASCRDWTMVGSLGRQAHDSAMSGSRVVTVGNELQDDGVDSR
ncbi:hypothetical protein TIFTF001_029144 [Ficus carica]|uniref:Uncharacterized protein n=1 Tax=Ficus carica TaxID=3494 RepID=A0AA88J306_FICCA|nr:hypothetical protein TIFTF001_029144 [Ficus carica]